MKKLIAVLLPLLILGGCASGPLTELEDTINKGEMKLNEGVAKYKEYKKLYVEKRQHIKDLIEVYYGESEKPVKDETGIQDVVYRRYDTFTEDEKEQLEKANETVDELVNLLKDLDQKMKELDQDIQEGIVDAREFIDRVQEIIRQSKKTDNVLETVGGIITQSVKLEREFDLID